MESLRYYIRQHQPKNKLGQNIVYQGANPQSLITILGNVSISNYIEITEDVIDDRKFGVFFKQKDSGQIEEGSSTELVFTGKAYNTIKEWLIDSVSASINAIEIKVRDEECGTEYTDWIIYNHGIKNCKSDFDICEITLNIRQRNEIFECIEKTSIADNHLGWFNNNNNKSIRFDYCNEFRPTGLLTVALFAICMLAFIMFVVLAPIIIILTVIIAIINALIWLTGGDPIDNPLSFGDLKDMFNRMFVDVAGCGREFIGVLVRDYVQNVCTKCGLQVDQYTFPIYFDPASPYYNGTIIAHEVKKGVDNENNDRWWIKDNDPLLTLDMLLDEIRLLHNAKWFVKNKKLYFDRKDKLVGNTFVFDFINQDESQILEPPCFTWTEQRAPAYTRLEYMMDGFDNVANDSFRRYNAVVENNIPNNPLYKGELQKQITSFAPTRFRMDGIYKDYIEQAVEPLKIAATFVLVIYPFYLQARNVLRKFLGAILTQNHTMMLKKIVVWDGVSRKNARVKYVYDYQNLPPANSFYNTTGASYHSYHEDDVQYDIYEGKATRLYNFDYCFEEYFLNNLYDRHHQIDDPRIRANFYKRFDIKIALCCENINKLNLQNNAEGIVLEEKIKIDAGQFYKEGIIEEIAIDYDEKSITLKGRI